MRLETVFCFYMFAILAFNAVILGAVGWVVYKLLVHFGVV